MTQTTQDKQDPANIQGQGYRSSVNQAIKPAKGLRKWKTGAKVWVRNPETKTLDWHYTVVGAEYNEERRSWDYKLKTDEGIPYNRWVPELDLKKG